RQPGESNRQGLGIFDDHIAGPDARAEIGGGDRRISPQYDPIEREGPAIHVECRKSGHEPGDEHAAQGSDDRRSDRCGEEVELEVAQADVLSEAAELEDGIRRSVVNTRLIDARTDDRDTRDGDRLTL